MFDAPLRALRSLARGCTRARLSVAAYCHAFDPEVEADGGEAE